MLLFTRLFWVSAVVLAAKEPPPSASRDSFHLKLHHVGQHSPRTRWPHVGQKHHQQDDYREGLSHGHDTESTTEYPSYSALSQDFWRPSLTNYTATSYGYSKPYLSTAGGTSLQDSIRGSYHQYQQVRPKGTHSMKKTPTHYKDKYPMIDTFGKPKFKKTILYQSPSSYKKAVYPRVHKPYAKNKYPMQKTVRPAYSMYRRYYQSPYQRYASEILRYRDGYYKGSTLPTLASDRYYTTERMDDRDGTPTAEEYSNYNYTYGKSDGSYYEGYEEVENTTAEPQNNSYDEGLSTTRGYYGDRIYMSTQVPVLASDKIPIKNRFYIIRRTSSDDDIETIFE